MIRAFKSKGVAAAKTLLFPNGVRFPQPKFQPAAGEFRKRLHIAPDEPIALYSGNLGVKHGLGILLEAARILREQPIRLIVCGDGADRESLTSKARETALPNLTLLPLQAEPQYLEMITDTDIYLVTQRPDSGAVFFPSKLFKGLAWGKAVVVVADEDSELTRATREAGFGVIVNPRRPDELAAALLDLAKDPQKRQTLAERGRRYAGQFELDRLLNAFADELRELVGNHGSLSRSASPSLATRHVKTG
jgi:colanic acid biosynthesis glycosyl transferase WcaI